MAIISTALRTFKEPTKDELTEMFFSIPPRKDALASMSEAVITPSAAGGEPALRRSIGPFQLFAYTLGGMLGAGIYGLVGRAAGQLGSAVWLGFIVAMVAALLTGLSYASLGSRYPRAAARPTSRTGPSTARS